MSTGAGKPAGRCCPRFLGRQRRGCRDESRATCAAADHRPGPAPLPLDRWLRPARRRRRARLRPVDDQPHRNGERGIRAGELGKLLAEYRADPDGQAALEGLACAPEEGWWDDYRDLLTLGYADFAATEAAAVRIEVYAPLQVPELLQTRDHARAVAAADPRLPARLQPVAVDALTARQDAIARDGHAEIVVILGEAALRQSAGRPAVLRAQLHFLADSPGTRSRLTIHVLPFTTGPNPAGGTGAFSILRFSPALGPGLVLADGPGGGIFLDSMESVTAYDQAFTGLRAHALDRAESIRLLRSMTSKAS